MDNKRFDFAVKAVLKHEGGFSDNPNDPGGATNFGISLRFLKEMNIHIDDDDDIDIDDVKDVHFTDAIDIYKKYWWDKYNYDAISSLSIAAKVFDMAVNMGAKRAHKIVQQSCTYCGHKDLKIDGILGIKSLSAINEITTHGRESDLMSEIINEQKWFYEHLVEDNPTLKVFLKGWINRASWVPYAPN